MTNKESNKEILSKMYEIIAALRLSKRQAEQESKSDIVRVYAVTITLMEGALGYFKVWCVDNIYFPSKYES